MPHTHAHTPVWSMLSPAIGLGAFFAVGGGTGAIIGVVLTLALLANVQAAVHHAEVVAARVGEPFGAIILALAVTVIEVGLIVSIMLGDTPQPTLVRDTVHAVVVLVLHGMAGLCIVVGTLKHREQEFRVEGASAYLIVLLPMAIIVLVLPTVTTSGDGLAFSVSQLAFVSVACLALYIAFTFVQTVRHTEFFTEMLAEAAGVRPSARRTAIAFGLMLVSLVAVVLLAKAFSPFIQQAAAAIGAPVAIVGVAVAAIVLLPEAATALRAASQNRLQTSINLALGSGVASIGLTIPTVAAVSWATGVPLTLGVSPGAAVLLGLSFLMAVITYGTGRTNLLSGLVHLILFATRLFLIFQP